MSQSVLSLARRHPPKILRLHPSGRSLAVASALALFAGGLYGIARETSMFAIRTLQVSGGTAALDAQARAALRSFDGTSLLRLNGARVIGRVEDLAGVSSAAYDRDFPHTLRVRLVPEQPVGVLRQEAAAWLVSASGRVIAAVDRLRAPTLPRIWLPAATNVEIGATLDGADGATARSLAIVAARGFRRRITWAHTANGQLVVGLVSGLEVRFGAAAELRLKLAILKSILPTLVPVAAGGPSYVDLSAPERPVAGRNPQAGGRG